MRSSDKVNQQERESDKRITNSKPIPHIPLPFKEVMADVLKVKPPEKPKKVKSERHKLK
jgi:hypothetical protein